jgi:hypothetical protein
MEGLAHRIELALTPIYGLKLSISRNAGSMKNFQFGTITPHPSGPGTAGQYGLHIQCPWRMVSASQILTGSGDWWVPAESEDDLDWEAWDKRRPTPSLQQKLLETLFQQYDPGTKSWINTSDRLIVERVTADDFGGFDLHLTGDFRLQVFPSGKNGESWRLLQPATDAPHLVFEDGELTGN